jgi:hypothetical protein
MPMCVATTTVMDVDGMDASLSASGIVPRVITQSHASSPLPPVAPVASVAPP